MNYTKSLLFISPNVDIQAGNELSEHLGIPRTPEIGRYLPHHLMHKGRSNGSQGVLIQKVKEKLEGWKSRCLSRTGRLNLAKFVLSNMVVFHMQLQKLKRSTHKELDKTIRECIWGSSTAREKFIRSIGIFFVDLGSKEGRASVVQRT